MKLPSLTVKRQIRDWPREFGHFLRNNWWVIISILLVFSLIVLLYGTKLMGLTSHHLSVSEQAYFNHLQKHDLSLISILKFPINLPYLLGVYALEKVHQANPLAFRAISATFGAIALGSFYWLIRIWHTRRVAILSSILYGSSAWVLHTSRLGLPDVLFLLPCILLICATWLETSRKRRFTLCLCLFSSILLVYIPSLLLFVIAGAAWQAKRIYAELRHTSMLFVVPWIMFGLIMLVPLFWMLLINPHNIIPLLGLPNNLPPLKQFLINLLLIPVHLIVRGQENPEHWLGHLPILDIFSSLMVALGVYAYAFRFRLDRTKLLTGIFICGSMLIALNGAVSITFLVPFTYILAAGGMTLMFQQWKMVFPRNPVAKSLATTLMSLVVLVAAFYNINHYFIAWPNAPETRQVFAIR